MDFIIGILLFAIVILVLFNFTSISISDKPNSGTCANQNYLIASMQQSQQDTLLQPTGVPQPILAKSANNKDVLATRQPVYDYSKYFFVKG
jgi:hypothetical protein